MLHRSREYWRREPLLAASSMGPRESSDTVGDDEYDEEKENESNADILGLGEYPGLYT
jgi:hypothetical protein